MILLSPFPSWADRKVKSFDRGSPATTPWSQDSDPSRSATAPVPPTQAPALTLEAGRVQSQGPGARRASAASVTSAPLPRPPLLSTSRALWPSGNPSAPASQSRMPDSILRAQEHQVHGQCGLSLWVSPVLLVLTLPKPLCLPFSLPWFLSASASCCPSECPLLSLFVWVPPSLPLCLSVCVTLFPPAFLSPLSLFFYCSLCLCLLRSLPASTLCPPAS